MLGMVCSYIGGCRVGHLRAVRVAFYIDLTLFEFKRTNDY